MFILLTKKPFGNSIPTGQKRSLINLNVVTSIDPSNSGGCTLTSNTGIQEVTETQEDIVAKLIANGITVIQ